MLGGRTENIVAHKSFNFAVRSVRLVQYLNKEHKEYILSKQVLRSGTAIGALVSEAKYAQSRADFPNKLSIALKEANETCYWIRLLHETGYLDNKMNLSLKSDAEEILSLLVSITKSASPKASKSLITPNLSKG
ncbi:four helix bundle protein [Nitratifractor sp.]